jgi:xanthine dehydrogenase accessory factor
MSDLEPILTLWRELESAGSDYVLATIVSVEGSSYRRPGARMLIAADGRRAGTVSGGCLEAEVAQRCFWLTESGPAVERFSTYEDEGERPYGSGCGGMVSILLERRRTAASLLAALAGAFEQRMPLAIATILEGPNIGQRAFAGPHSAAAMSCTDQASGSPTPSDLQLLAETAFVTGVSMDGLIHCEGVPAQAWAHFQPARPGLWIFSAGDDAKPLERLARELGWFTAIVDGRSHLATRDRFPAANLVSAIDIVAVPGAAFVPLGLKPTDAAVVMTHSIEQDSRCLAALLALETPLNYVGVLGPQRRTREMLAEAAHLLRLPASEDRIERWLAAIHAPTGLDLGADTPATIALSILSEIQQILSKSSALPLRMVRAAKLEEANS